MTQQSETKLNASMAPLQDFLKRLLSVQAELAEGMVDLNRHWLEQSSVEWTEALELARKVAGNDTASEKVTALRDWLKAATERGMNETKHTMETVRALGNLELKLLARSSDESEVNNTKAA